MSIADKLKALKRQPKLSTRETLPDGLLTISDGVWAATLYRLGYDAKQFETSPIDSRGEILERLEINGV